jgi:NADH:ubiquinone oxidoreductase subunit C
MLTATVDSVEIPLSAVLSPRDLQEALNGAAVIAYTEANTSNLVVYRQHTQELALFLKLHSAFSANIAVDCYAVDNVDAASRFTVVYALQSSTGNARFNIITKTTEVLALISLQGPFPAFNWAEREV